MIKNIKNWYWDFCSDLNEFLLIWCGLFMIFEALVSLYKPWHLPLFVMHSIFFIGSGVKAIEKQKNSK